MKKYGRELSTKDTLPNDIPPECLDTILYKFGSNHLLIGNGIADMLKLIENRYNIDICKLEHKYQMRIARENRERQKDKEQEIIVQKSMRRSGYTIHETPYYSKYFMASNEHLGYLIYSVRRSSVSINDIDDIIQKQRNSLLSILFNGVDDIRGMIVSKRKFSRKVIEYAKDNDILLIPFSTLENDGLAESQ